MYDVSMMKISLYLNNIAARNHDRLSTINHDEINKSEAWSWICSKQACIDQKHYSTACLGTLKPVKHDIKQVNPPHDTTCLKSHHQPRVDQFTTWYNLNMEGYKHTIFKASSWTCFTRDGIAEYSCTAESGSVEKEQTMQDQQAWTHNTWQSRLIQNRLLENA
jgi:hypothetical protein